MPWGQGFVAHPDGDHAASHIKSFLRSHAQVFGHLFLSWQPRSRAALRLDDYTEAWDDLLHELPGYPVRGLHHTLLNLAASARYRRTEILDFTNALVERYQLTWVNEDLGFWSLGGRSLPYPLPPPLTPEGRAVCIRNVREVDDALTVPLRLEFPGFSAGWSLCIGDIDAYDFFRVVVEEAGCECTLDVGHLLSWRWRCGHRGNALLEGLDRLPLDPCVEIHLSGVAIEGEQFIDAHHGQLIDAQYQLLERLLAACPNARSITFEDPVIRPRGDLDHANRTSLERLRAYA